MGRVLRIAHCVESYAPALGGMPEVVKQLSERMVRLGHQVTVLTSAHPQRLEGVMNGVQVRAFNVSGNLVKGLHGHVEEYRSALVSGGFDIVVFFAAQQWATDAALEILAAIPAKKVFVPTGFSALRQASFASYYERMPNWMDQMDLNVFLSHTYQDIRFAEKEGVTARTVIPNGAAAEEFDAPAVADMRALLGIPEAAPLILHVGSFTGIKGHREAIELFVRTDTQRAALVLVGNGNLLLKRLFQRHWRYFGLRALAALRRKRIFFLELDRASTVALMKQADLFLFPSQVECSPIVLFEAMAASLPFLASSAGNTTEIVQWTQGGWVMPCSSDSQGLVNIELEGGARMLGDLLRDKQRLKAAGARGNAAWRERFTWERVAHQYLYAYLRLTDMGHGEG
jgi:L-malate glycosyltransferase